MRFQLQRLWKQEDKQDLKTIMGKLSFKQS